MIGELLLLVQVSLVVGWQYELWCYYPMLSRFQQIFFVLSIDFSFLFCEAWGIREEVQQLQTHLGMWMYCNILAHRKNNFGKRIWILSGISHLHIETLMLYNTWCWFFVEMELKIKLVVWNENISHFIHHLFWRAKTSSCVDANLSILQ